MICSTQTAVPRLGELQGECSPGQGGILSVAVHFCCGNGHFAAEQSEIRKHIKVSARILAVSSSYCVIVEI